MTALNWQALLTGGIDESNASKREAQESVEFYHQRSAMLHRYREGKDTNHPSLQPTGWEDQPWRVWIPPFNASHFDADSIIGPFGDTYFTTLVEATTFLKNVLDDLTTQYAPPPEPEPEPEELAHVRFKVGTNVRSWVEYELADATPEEVEVLSHEDSPAALDLARQLCEAGRLIEHDIERDDNPDYFDSHAEPAVIDVEVEAPSPVGMEEG